ncbi:MAG: 2-oxo acid dehydrogenase subunit E2 [Acidobacteriota bacterium]|nr:MAG: 2-oxo acid dehydrogenase subunit E2 [Acidobacteriota bacterium]
MGKLIDVVVPREQQEGTRSVVGAWFKQPGEVVSMHEPLLELSTDKVTVELPAPVSGTLREIIKKENEEVEPGAIVGRIEEEAVQSTDVGLAATDFMSPAASVAQPADSPRSGRELRLSPAVRRLIKEHGIDPAAILGSGRRGRITHRDVLTHLDRPRSPSAAPAPRTASSLVPGSKVPHSPMRRAIARHMVESALRTAPHVTAVFEADLSRVLAHRDRHKDDAGRIGARLTLTAYFVAASVKALQQVPQANSRWHEDHLELFADYNIGVATAIEREGLLVPVLHGAQSLDLVGIARKLEDLARKARAGRLEQRDLDGGTFTITNHGVSGSLLATPIINQPQSAILGVGKLQKRPVVVEQDGIDAIAIKPMVYVTLTIDHRALDGFTANVFLSRFVEVLESWSESTL